MKHDNYKSVATITLEKTENGQYMLSYDDESWTLWADKDEILEELGEHMDNMKKKGE